MVELRDRLAKEGVAWIWKRMSRTKTLPTDVMATPLKRCLTTLDITLLGIGHMVGAGIYVLTGTVAKDTAGPAIVISFLLSGFVSVLSSLCYAEFGARVPRAGSAYVYTYVTVGEFWAFVIGWNIILEHMIGAASVSRAWSGYIDSLFGGAISNSTLANVGGFHETFLAPYPDPIAFCVTIVYCALLSIGVKGSAYFNSIFTLVNMCVMVFVILVGFFYANIKNWQTEGGFAPFGFSGIIAGAATSFYAFVGFDSIASSSEEALNPKRSIPLATITSMAVVTTGYVLVGAVLTLMVPYYQLTASASIPDAFADNGIYWAKYIVSVGALCGMTTSLFGSLFSLPRCVYAMASDGLLFSWLAKVSDKTQVPVLNLILCGLLTAVIALVFDIEKLVEFMSIGTLMAYTIVSASVIILRYNPVGSFSHQASKMRDDSEIPPTSITPSASEGTEKAEILQAKTNRGDLRPSFKWVLRYVSADFVGQSVTWAVAIFVVTVAALSSLFQWGFRFLEGPVEIWAVLLIILFMIIMTLSVVIIAAHRQVENELTFKVPLVPFIPLLSIFCNVCLMVHLNPMTWVRFIIWMSIGLLLYFLYGMHHSKEGQPVSSYSTLLSESAPTGETVFGTVHQKLSQVTSKIISTANETALTSKKLKDDDWNAPDKQKIIEKDPEVEEIKKKLPN